jgi:hypothetical protein
LICMQARKSGRGPRNRELSRSLPHPARENKPPCGARFNTARGLYTAPGRLTGSRHQPEAQSGRERVILRRRCIVLSTKAKHRSNSTPLLIGSFCFLAGRGGRGAQRPPAVCERSSLIASKRRTFFLSLSLWIFHSL